MTPEEENELVQLVTAHAAAEGHEERTRFALYAWLQPRLRNPAYGELKRIVELTPLSRQRLHEIKVGKWSRDKTKNPSGDLP